MPTVSDRQSLSLDASPVACDGQAAASLLRRAVQRRSLPRRPSWRPSLPLRWLSAALASAVLVLAPVSSAQAFTVFACEPEWAALVHELLPDAKVNVATHERQDPHHIEARPALIAQLRSADLAVCTGASLEAGWLPMLQERASNAAVQVDAPGMFFATSAVPLIDAGEATLNPFAGDVHAEGNPHVQTDPHRMLTIARRLSERMQALEPDQAQAIGERFNRFEVRWKQQIDRWENEAQALRGARVVTQHTSFAYLWRWLGVEAVADLEPRPGLSPTPGHLQGLLKTLKPEPPAALVTALYHDPRAGRWLADQLGGKVPLLALPSSPAEPLADGALDRWYDAMLDPLLRAVRPAE